MIGQRRSNVVAIAALIVGLAGGAFAQSAIPRMDAASSTACHVGPAAGTYTCTVIVDAPTPIPSAAPSATPTSTAAPTPTPAPTPSPTATPVSCPTNLASAIAATPSGGTLNITGCAYATSSGFTIAHPMTLLGGTLSSTAAQVVLAVNAANVTVSGTTINGKGDAQAFSSGIWAYAADHLVISNTTVSDFVYAGIMVENTGFATLTHDTVNRIGMNVTGATNAYGYAITNDGGIQSHDSTITFDTVNGVPNWHGIDTHAALRSTITDNVIHGANRAIFITADSSGRASSSVVVSRNFADTPTRRGDVLNTYPYNEVGITFVAGTTGVTGTANSLDGWPSGNAVDFQGATNTLTNTTVSNAQ